MICSGSRDYSIKIWDVSTGELIREYSCPRNIVTCVIWPSFHDNITSPLDGNIVLQGSEDLCIRGWDVRQSSKQPSIHLTGFQYFPLCINIDPLQPLLAAGCKGFNGVGCDIKIWDIRYFKPGKFLYELPEHQQDVTSCQFLPIPNSHLNLNNNSDNTILEKTNFQSSFLTTSRDCTLKYWSISDSNSTKNSISTYTDRSSYNCLDSWYDYDKKSWYCCLGDMDGSVSIISLPSQSQSQSLSQSNEENNINQKVNFKLQWKSPIYTSNEEYVGDL